MFNKSKILIISLLFFILISGVYAGGGETNTTYHQYDNISTYQDIIYAEEDGHFDIQFTDNYRGYCFEYGEEEATKSDKLYAEQTDYVLNSNGDDVSNELKTYFVEYYNETQKDKVVTQHTIWHFTDNFNGWRVNKTLVDEIRNISEHNKISDDGKREWNSTHEMIYSFRSLISPIEEHQNFFAYKILFQVMNASEDNSTISNNTTNNTTDIIENITDNLTDNITDITNNSSNNSTNNNINNSDQMIGEDYSVSLNSQSIKDIENPMPHHQNIYLKDSQTGNNVLILLVSLALIFIIIAIYKKP